MKKNGWLAVAVGMVILIAGAGVLYNKYSAEVDTESLMVEDSTQAEIKNEQTEVMDPETETSETQDEEKEISMAPDFTVYDMEGTAVKLSDFIGKPTVVNFWASWCGPCKMEMPDFEAKYQELGEEINFLMVNMTDGGRETVEKAKDFMASSGYSFPVYYDTDMDAAMTYGVTSIPSTYFIDAEGRAIAWAQGMIDEVTLQQGIEMIME